jgi:hypothetical protein
VAMKINRTQLGCLSFAVVTLVVLGTFYHRATVPFKTAQTFINHLHDHQLDDAKFMIIPADREKLPAAYWDRIADTEFRDEIGWSMSYTPESLLHSIVVFWVNVPDGPDWQRDSSVQHYAHGRVITIHEVDLMMTPQ